MKSILKENIPNEIYNSKVILYGGGITCQRILGMLQSYHIHIHYILDDDGNKWGNRIGGIEIISFHEFEKICMCCHNVSIILATIYGKTVLKRLNQIRSSGNIEIYEMYDWLDEEYNLNCLIMGMDNPKEIEKFNKEIPPLINKLADEESRKVLEGIAAYINYKTPGIIGEICTENEQYFIPEVLDAIRGPVSIVDGGAYGGELYQAIKKNNIELKQWYCFEADNDNYCKLLSQSKKIGLAGIQICEKKGLWDKGGVLYFDGRNDTVSRIVDYETDIQVETITLNDYFKDKSFDFLKFDIEGAEYPALCGAMKVIKRDRPILAISIYHSIKDFYRIPDYLMQELVNYRYIIRHHALILSETVLYAIPVS